MPRPSVYLKALRDVRWQVFWYGVGLASMAALVVFIYPPYSEQFADFEIPDAFRAFFGDFDFATPEGFLGTEFFANWVPALMVIFGLMQGTNALAGEEVSGTMDIILAQPIRRARLLLEKLAAFLTATLVIVAIICVGWLLSVPFVEEMDVPLARIFAATFALLPLAAAFYAFSLWLAALLPTRSAATGVAAMAAVFTFFGYTLSLVVEVLSFLRWLSPFFYYDGAAVVRGEYDLWKLAVILASFAAFTVLAIMAFERREISVRQVESSLFSLPFRRRAA